MLNFRKPSRTIIAVALIVLIVLSVGFVINRTVSNISLPDAESVISITMNQYNAFIPIGEVTITDKGEINQILNALSGATKTRRQSVNDSPVVGDYLVVRFDSTVGTRASRTLFLYTDGEDYIEEPYVGIYRPNRQFNYIYSVYAAYSSGTGQMSPDQISSERSGSLALGTYIANTDDGQIRIRLQDYGGFNISYKANDLLLAGNFTLVGERLTLTFHDNSREMVFTHIRGGLIFESATGQESGIEPGTIFELTERWESTQLATVSGISKLFDIFAAYARQELPLEWEDMRKVFAEVGYSNSDFIQDDENGFIVLDKDLDIKHARLDGSLTADGQIDMLVYILNQDGDCVSARFVDERMIYTYQQGDIRVNVSSVHELASYAADSFGYYYYWN